MPRSSAIHGTTILAVRHRGQSALAGDGQVTFGTTVMKGEAVKIRTMHGGQVLGSVSLPLRGVHNVRNATGALAMAVSIGVPFDVAATALATLVAFISGYASIAWLLSYLANHTLCIFVAYRIPLGILVIALAATGAIS